MVGYLRLVLAFLVILSHLQVRMHGYNPGVFAVGIFYILAGWVISKLWHDVLGDTVHRVRLIIIDRCLRIVPLYLFVASLTLLFVLATGYGAPSITIIKLIFNGLIIPLNYYMWLDAEILSAPAWCLVPPAWSLGAELQAYIIMVLLFNVPMLRWGIVTGAAAVYLAASFGSVPSELFSYRILPGILIFFIAGSCLQRMQQGDRTLFVRLVPYILFLGAGIVLCLLSIQGVVRPYVAETLLALVVGIPLVWTIHSLKYSYRGNRICGSLSYGVFLSHFLVIWLLDYIQFHGAGDNALNLNYFIYVIGGSLLIASGASGIVELPIDKYRKALTSKRG